MSKHISDASAPCNAPAPFVPQDCDLRSFPYTPIFRSRLFGSSFHAKRTDAEWRAGVTLWLRSWDQLPAGSLPSDDIELCRLAELGRDLKCWMKVRSGALHGWVLCSDNRLYHQVVAEGVIEAWRSKLARQSQTEAARAALRLRRGPQDAKFATGLATEIVTGSNRDGDFNREGNKKDFGREKKYPGMEGQRIYPAPAHAYAIAQPAHAHASAHRPHADKGTADAAAASLVDCAIVGSRS